MPAPIPFVRELGAGTAVVCLHASASHSGQWRGFMERMADRFRVIAVDLYGSGRTAAWPGDRPLSLDDEVALLSPVFEAAGDRFHLVGHSLGGAIALKAALADQARLISLAIYEPVLFGLLLAEAPESAESREILAVRDDTVRLVDEGDLEAAAERFLDYWMGEGAWAATSEQRRPVLAGAMRAVKQEWHALFDEPAGLTAFAAIEVPALLLTGSASRAPARAIARLLADALANVRVEEIEGVGHMAPLTAPDTVNGLIERFLTGGRSADSMSIEAA